MFLRKALTLLGCMAALAGRAHADLTPEMDELYRILGSEYQVEAPRTYEFAAGSKSISVKKAEDCTKTFDAIGQATNDEIMAGYNTCVDCCAKLFTVGKKAACVFTCEGFLLAR